MRESDDRIKCAAEQFHQREMDYLSAVSERDGKIDRLESCVEDLEAECERWRQAYRVACGLSGGETT